MGHDQAAAQMIVLVLYVGAALALLGCGWLASAWLHQRQIEVLRLQLRQAKQTAADHATQARKQIGQLQAELASRPPGRPRVAAPPTGDETVVLPQIPAFHGTSASGFAPTEIGPNGFEPTRLLA
ncbi:MAG: hypothetical protein JNN18_17625 [Rubrivivax sp.]|jgi:HAMP domain-containing protein|nr:hypothetical protein [Rubrivivax sp.]